VVDVSVWIEVSVALDAEADALGLLLTLLLNGAIDTSVCKHGSTRSGLTGSVMEAETTLTLVANAEGVAVSVVTLDVSILVALEGINLALLR
jgi:hypothetical protein